MPFLNKFTAGMFMYSAGAYVSYLDMNKTSKTFQQQETNKQKLTSLVAYNTSVSHHYAKEFYVNYVHPVVYIGAWPVIQCTMGSLSLFTGVLTGCLEWHELIKK